MKLNDAIANWWMTNARIVQGHPPQESQIVTPEPSPPMSTAAKLAIGAVAGAGGLAAADYMGWLDRGDAKPAAAVTEPAASDSSLYQYLEDNGYHLPE